MLFLTTFHILVSWCYFILFGNTVALFCTYDITIFLSFSPILVQNSMRNDCLDAVSLPFYCLHDPLQLSKFFNIYHFNAHFFGQNFAVYPAKITSRSDTAITTQIAFGYLFFICNMCSY